MDASTKTWNVILALPVLRSYVEVTDLVDGESREVVVDIGEPKIIYLWKLIFW